MPNLTKITINDVDLAPIETAGQRVVTLAMVDAVHQRADGTARRNFNQHRNRLIEGDDFVKMSADEFRTRFPGVISDRATEAVTLLTESGYLMLVKSFTDDLAWEVQRKLVNSYFRQAAAPAPQFAIPQTMAEALRLAADLSETVEEQKAVITEQQAAIAEQAPKAKFYDAFANTEGLFGLQNAGRALGMGPNKFIAFLKQGYLFYQGKNLIPRARYRDQGLFEVKITVQDDKSRPQTFVTPKGMEYFGAKFAAPEAETA